MLFKYYNSIGFVIKKHDSICVTFNKSLSNERLLQLAIHLQNRKRFSIRRIIVYEGPGT